MTIYWSVLLIKFSCVYVYRHCWEKVEVRVGALDQINMAVWIVSCS